MGGHGLIHAYQSNHKTMKKNQTAKSRPFKSRYYGECGVCGKFFDPGEVIVRLLTGYYRIEERVSKHGGNPYLYEVTRDYAHAKCAVQPPGKPGWLPDRYYWCTVCDDWWDTVEYRGVCRHTQPWYEQENRERWEEEYDEK